MEDPQRPRCAEWWKKKPHEKCNIARHQEVLVQYSQRPRDAEQGKKPHEKRNVAKPADSTNPSLRIRGAHDDLKLYEMNSATDHTKEHEEITQAVINSVSIGEPLEDLIVRRAMFESLVEPGHGNEERVKVDAIQHTHEENATGHALSIEAHRGELKRAREEFRNF